MEYPEWIQEQIEMAIRDGDLEANDHEAIRDFAEFCLRTGPADPEARFTLTDYGWEIARELNENL